MLINSYRFEAAPTPTESVSPSSSSFKNTGVVTAKSAQVTISSGGWYAVPRNGSSWITLGTGSPPADARMPLTGTLNSGDSVRFSRSLGQSVGTVGFIDIYVGSTLVATETVTLNSGG